MREPRDRSGEVLRQRFRECLREAQHVPAPDRLAQPGERDLMFDVELAENRKIPERFRAKRIAIAVPAYFRSVARPGGADFPRMLADLGGIST